MFPPQSELLLLEETPGIKREKRKTYSKHVIPRPRGAPYLKILVAMRFFDIFCECEKAFAIWWGPVPVTRCS
jgi:hypothetical protein